jgi:aminoglycoside phosphotransferase
MNTVAELTMEELEHIIDERLERRLALMVDDFDIKAEDLMREDERDTRTLEEVFESVRRNRWTPPLGAKSSLELLREIRER